MLIIVDRAIIRKNIQKILAFFEEMLYNKID